MGISEQTLFIFCINTTTRTIAIGHCAKHILAILITIFEIYFVVSHSNSCPFHFRALILFGDTVDTPINHTPLGDA